MTDDPRDNRCPDQGYCHSSEPCDPGQCYRVKVAGPFSGVFPGDVWPDEVLAAAGVEPRTPDVQWRLLRDAEALRGHLDALNESGTTPVVVGRDATPQSFLITLVGPYAEGEHVFFDSPWQGDVDWSNGHTHCDECRGHVHGIEDLRYPVVVMDDRVEEIVDNTGDVPDWVAS